MAGVDTVGTAIPKKLAVSANPVNVIPMGLSAMNAMRKRDNVIADLEFLVKIARNVPNIPF